MKIFGGILFSILAAWPQASFAWGREGHAIVADIAEAQLSPAARAQVARLLGSESKSHLSDIASWADAHKGEGLPSHSIRMPFNGGPGPADACPSHHCIVEGIGKYSAILADRNAPIAQRELALKVVVHLVGDVHQPLHCIKDTGAGVRVTLDGEATTLHKVWDSGIIKEQQHKAHSLAKALMGRNVATGGDPIAWAMESRDIARDTIYSEVPRKANAQHAFALPADYGDRNWPIIAQRLTQGGDRLARVLNQALR